jgi:carbon-monoxide dehydrogenase small subunit
MSQGGDARTCEVQLTVNGRAYRRRVESRRLLSDFIREDLRLTGTHVGCEHGVCGACTILWDGQPARSCLAFAVQADGAELRTVECLAPPGGGLHRVQEAFARAHALQCGYCTPGYLMAAVGLLEARPDPTEEEIVLALTGHLCRCTGYGSIVKAVAAAADAMRVAGHDASPRRATAGPEVSRGA